MRLEVSELRKNFGEKEVLHGVSFSIESGRALGLLGRNGAGKTTTIRILMDVFRANSGTITMDGEKFVPSRYQIGYLPEERGLYPKKRVDEQIVYLAGLRGMSQKEAKKNMKDVYKRQDVEILGSPGKTAGFIDFVYVFPVSYTHLVFQLGIGPK